MASRNPSVVIIGAGPSGIAAATKLLENGITNIKILEGQNRIGGRINTIQVGGDCVDLGAEYSHGGIGNIVYESVKDLNLLERVPDGDARKIAFYYSNGPCAIDSSLSIELTNLSFKLKELETNFDKNTLSIGELYDKVYNSTISKKYGNEPQKAKILSDALNYIKSCTELHSGAFSWYNSSLLDNYEVTEDPSNYIWKQGTGYQIFLDVLMKKYPNPSEKLDIDNKILLNRTVTKIDWKKNDGVVVNCSGEVFHADHVIFTPSIGVLKENADKLFVPELPASKRTAFEAIGLEGVVKIILRFPHRWWKEGLQEFGFLWSSDDLKALSKEFPNEPAHDGCPWLSRLVQISMPLSQSPIMILWVTGSTAPKVEKLSAETLQMGIMYTLRKFLANDHTIPEPEEIISSSWIDNPYTRGTHSFLQAGFYDKNISYNGLLAEPLQNANGVPVVLFAGEASNPTHFSTVHGAVETGYREANRIITLYKKD